MSYFYSELSEFQKILDHRGWSPTSPLYPLAHLGLARAAMLQGDPARARKSYQDFSALWKDADADLPVLIEAKKEFEKLKWGSATSHGCVACCECAD